MSGETEFRIDSGVLGPKPRQPLTHHETLAKSFPGASVSKG